MGGVFIFEDSLKGGKLGEELFYSKHKNTIRKLDGYSGDFITVQTNDKIELKSDFYDMEKTENFFMERYSDSIRKTVGGPWKAALDGCKYFVYFFVKNGVYFVFETEPLINKLESMVGLEEVPVVNTTWTAMGYKVKRDDLKDIFVKRIV